MDAIKTGKIINYLRSLKGMTQKELAAKINVSDKAVSKWERGDGCPDVGTLPLLAENLDCDVDSLIKGELPAKKVMTEEEIQAMLSASGQTPENDTSLLQNRNSRILNYDFKRPSIFKRKDMYKIYYLFVELCEKIRNEFVGNRPDFLGFSVASVDELTNNEFIRTLPERTFFYSYDYNNSGFAIEIAPTIGKILLKQDLKKYPDLTLTDAECLPVAYLNQFVELMQESIYSKTNKSVPKESFFKKRSLDLNPLLPRNTPQNPNEMCLLVTLELRSDTECGMMNIQFNYKYFTELCSKRGFFEDSSQEPKLQWLSDIKTKPRNNNIIVEFGRFIPNDCSFEAGTILVSQKRAGEPLNVIVENQVRYLGETVAVGESFGVRITEALKDNDEKGTIIKYDEENYISLRLGEAYCTQEEISRIKENTILELDNVIGNPVRIIQDGKVAAHGEVIIVDDYYAVRVTE
jgi:flagellar motor switch/type III secretory pathway protein FliN/transcriptional regulator with XRE-family HTH domain